jgi:hypothetical protein
MGKINSSTGAATGRISRMVFYQLNGQEVVRGLGVKKKIKSKKVLAQNSSFKLLMQFFSKMKPFIKAGFKNEASGTIFNYHNLATSYNQKYAMGHVDEQPVILYNKVLLCRGNALPPKNPQVSVDHAGLRFSWDIESSLPWTINQDQAMMLAWFPEINETLFTTAGAARKAGTDLLPLTTSYQNLQIETYIAFVSEDRESVSNSIYLGSISKQH